MIVGIPKETRSGETRVSATPESVKKLVQRKLKVRVEASAGELAHFPDRAYCEAGAEVVATAQTYDADILFKVNRPSPDEVSLMKPGALLVSLGDLHRGNDVLERLAERKLSAIALELIPRISRAQSMDVLSSQAGIAGYRAVLEAANHYGRFFSMMMTSAGSCQAAKVAVLGAGVAGLQAIATARRLGATVEAYDIRPEAKEQILSLGAKCIEIEVGEEGRGQGGYARELGEEAQRRQRQALGERLKKFDVIVSTANVPGKKSPVLIEEDAVRNLRAGSVIVDMAAENGGNCPLTEAGRTVVKHGVTLIGVTNFPALVPTDASRYFAQNLISLLDLVWKENGGERVFALDLSDEILASAVIVNQGVICRRP